MPKKTPKIENPATNDNDVQELAGAFERVGLGIQWLGKDGGKAMTVGSLDLPDILKVVAQLPTHAASAASLTREHLFAAFERAGVAIQWVGKTVRKPMTFGSLDLRVVLEIIAALPQPDTAPAAPEETFASPAQLVSAAAQAAPSALFADAIARLAAHDHAAAKELAAAYLASLKQAPEAPAAVLDAASEDVKTVLHAVATLKRFWAGTYWEGVTHADCAQIEAAFAVLTANQN